LAKAWHQTSIATRATYFSLFFFLLLLYSGIRWIRYSNAYIHLNCRLETCDLQIMPLGWGRKLRLEFPRRQLLDCIAVKTDAQGVLVEGTPNINDDYNMLQPHHNHSHSKHKGKKHSSPHKQSSKGPDENGHYVSYAIVLTDEEEVVKAHDAGATPTEEQADHNGNESDHGNNELTIPIKDLSIFKDYLDPLEVQQVDNNSTTQQQPQRKYRLVVRKFRIGQSRRRVRVMLSKLDAYIKRRRTQLVVKETSAPAWQGILGIVLGLMGALLTLLIGQLWDERPPSASGPGVRRETTRGNSNSNRSHQDAMRRTTPAKYEVATSHQPVRLTTASKRNTTSISQRDRIREPWIQTK
jgi:hypothetical protein